MTRLLDLGIEPYLVASSVVGVLAQRLVRRVCEECAVPHAPTRDELAKLGLQSDLDTSRMRMGAGCAACRQTGFRGRIGLFELMAVSDAVRRQVQAMATAAQVREAAVSRGMKTLRDDGIAKALRGQTTLQEVMRVTMGGRSDGATVGASEEVTEGKREEGTEGLRD